mmetsp:Transcript_6387/g.13160  ORF Transcript_6387/g.13160 Transcript_6387/m.13160 type:complete len:275 (+) Transcript_6387:84-908(+)|eukprot:scaffold34681_cov154-Amphora_coffeaeformis.AAC.3
MTDESPMIDEILHATTHYDVLGVDSMDLDTAALRKAYLRRSLKIHPDKSNDPRAKEAFQKVAQAWQVLSDGTSRAQYDQALKRGQADLNDDYDNSNDNDYYYNGDGDAPRRRRQHETYYAGPPPSMQESLFLFATVVGSMMGGGKSMGNMTEALYWAEKLMSRTADRGDSDEPLSTADKATMAMAFGSGLKVASNAARSLGFRESAAKMEQAAHLAQMASVGVMVAEQPAVQRVIQQGSESLRKFKGGIDVVRAVLNHQQKESQETRNNQQQQR